MLHYAAFFLQEISSRCTARQCKKPWFMACSFTRHESGVKYGDGCHPWHSSDMFRINHKSGINQNNSRSISE
jgi:hypothetical protein